MAFNGSGVFNRIYNWVTDKSNNINITASRMDAEMDGMATGLSTCITKDGQTTITANIPMNSKKFTGLNNGSDRTDSIALGQVQDNTYGTLGTLGGSADTYTASPSPSITAYATGMEYSFKVNADNTGASTLNISAVAAKNIKKYDGAGSKLDLSAGDLQQDQYYKVIYDGTDFILLNPESTAAVTTTSITTDTLIVPDSGELTISTGAITVTDSKHTVDTESDAASDDLDTISGGTTGQILILSSANDARDVVIKHGTGNIITDTQTDITLGLTNDRIVLEYDGSNWIVITRSVNNDFLCSKATSGYSYLPNGMIVQWGLSGTITQNSSSAVSFPVTFPNACLNVTAAHNLTNAAITDSAPLIVSFTTSAVTLGKGTNGGGSAHDAGIYWRAIGY